MVHELPCCGSSEIERPSEPGWIDSTPELPRTSSWSPWRTSWHALHGPCCRAARIQTCHRITARNRRLRRKSATRSHFTAPRRRLEFTHRSLHRNSKDERTVTTACLQPDTDNGLHDRPTYKDRHAAELIMARRDDLHPKAEYIAADLSLAQTFPLQSCGGPYIVFTF